MPDVAMFSDGGVAEQYNLDSGQEKPKEAFADEIVNVFWKVTNTVKNSILPHKSPVDENIQVSSST